MLIWVFIIYGQMISVVISIESSSIYVDSIGIDYDECGAESNPCGTIGFAMTMSMYHAKYINYATANLFVKGQNEQEIQYWQNNAKQKQSISFIEKFNNNKYYFNKYSPCLNYISMNKSYTITFDRNKIKSMSDWFPSKCNENFENKCLFYRMREKTDSDTAQIITFNNLIVSDITISSDSDTIRTFIATGHEDDTGTHLILNNCSFYNINKEHYRDIQFNEHFFIIASSIQIYNTEFYDITYSSNSQSYYDTSFIYLKVWVETAELEIFLDNCTIINFYNYNGFFIYFNGQNHLNDVRSLSIYNSIFSNIKTKPTLIKSVNFQQSWDVLVNIKSSKFVNIQLGAILVTENGNIATIQNVEMMTSQLIEDSDNEYLLSLFSFSIGDDIQMIDINLKYLYDLNINCDVSTEPDEYPFYIIHYITCKEVIQFIQNTGMVNITSFTVENNIRYNVMETYIPNPKVNTYKCGENNNICYFQYTTHVYDSPYALIQNSGELWLNNFYIHGTGIYPQIVKNTGNTNVNNLISEYEYYYNNNDCSLHNNCVYDSNTLGISIYFRNEGVGLCGGSLQIQNSYIYGAKGAAIWALSGNDIYVDNSIIEYSGSAISAFPQVIQLHINNVQFLHIGAFYQNIVDIGRSVGIATPLFISAKQTVINNCYFSFFNPFGFIQSVPSMMTFFSGSFNVKGNDMNHIFYETTLINNSFELNTN
eukprot:210394_1